VSSSQFGQATAGIVSVWLRCGRGQTPPRHASPEPTRLLELAEVARGTSLAALLAMRGRTTVATLILLLAACSNQTAEVGTATPDPSATESPTAAPTATATAEPTPTPTPQPTPEPTPTPFGAAVFDDPDNCEHSSSAYRVALPDSWWWNTAYEHDELGTLAACRFFSPEQFDITTASREQPIPDRVSLWMDYAEGGCFGYINPILEEREVTVDGFTATVTEFAEGKREDNPPSYYQYLLDLTPELPCEDPESARIVATTGVDLYGDYKENKAMLNRMMETMQIGPP
jgi:hypothetical protein